MHFPRRSMPILNALTSEPYLLQSIDFVKPTDHQLARIVAICNEPPVYDWLFRRRFQGSPYPKASAQDFLAWSTEGWRNGTHFVFAVLDAQDNIVAACDIKSANLDNAEIGYWCSASHRGIMTNAVRAMLTLATDSGFRSFTAEAHQDNLPSQRVLLRCSFTLSQQPPREPGYQVYHLQAGAATEPEPYYHGTRADLQPGDLIVPGYSSNFGARKKANHAYFSATLNAAIWGAELAQGEGPGRIYLIEPTGPYIDDPNLTNKKFPGNLTESYRSKKPLRVISEIKDWQGHTLEELQTMKAHLERLKQQGIEAEDD